MRIHDNITFTVIETTCLAGLMNQSQQASARLAAEALMNISLLDSMMTQTSTTPFSAKQASGGLTPHTVTFSDCCF